MKSSVLVLKKPGKSLVKVSISRFQNFESRSQYHTWDHGRQSLSIGLKSVNPVSQIIGIDNLINLTHLKSSMHNISHKNLIGKGLYDRNVLKITSAAMPNYMAAFVSFVLLKFHVEWFRRNNDNLEGMILIWKKW